MGLLDSLNPIGLGIDAVSQGAKSLFGLYQMLHGNHKLNNLQMPQYSVNQNFKDNVGSAAQLYNQEWSPYDTSNINQALGSSLNATLQGGGNLGQINNSFLSSTDAYKSLAEAHDRERTQRLQILMGAKKDLADENMKAWNWNTAIPYQQAFNKWSNMTNSGWENIFGGLSGIGKDALAYGDYNANIDNGTKKPM